MPMTTRQNVNSSIYVTMSSPPFVEGKEHPPIQRANRYRFGNAYLHIMPFDSLCQCPIYPLQVDAALPTNDA